MNTDTPLLFCPMPLRGLTLPNRLVLAPMMQYRAENGFAADWHLAHYSKFAFGGFGTVMTEVVAVEPAGRITHGDLGLWSDEFIPGLTRVTDFVHSQGALAAIQIGHAGRKASSQRVWEGGGPLTAADAAHGEAPWTPRGPSDLPYGPEFPKPHALTIPEIEELITKFGEAVARAERAGFDIVEIHGAHGYLISSFLSPVTNNRQDAYGGDLNGRMKFALDVTSEIRANWPSHKPLFFRISIEDGAGKEGWSLADSLAIAPLLAERGVDIIDCSSGGINGSPTVQNSIKGLGYQVPYAEQIKNAAKVPSMAVGLILYPQQAEDIVQSGQSDLIAVGRQALYDPFWPLHALQALAPDNEFKHWNESSGWWLQRRANALAKFGLAPSGEPLPQ